MKIFIVCSGNSSIEKFDFMINQSFVYEQIESLREFGIVYDTYFIKGKGLWGYLKNFKALQKKINICSPDLVHAHYGFSGLLCVFQRKIPVIITFHGTDTNRNRNRIFSFIASKLSSQNIFVNVKQPDKINCKKRVNIIPCGVDTKMFYPLDKHKTQKLLNLVNFKKLVLFSSRFDNKVKNYELAFSSIAKLNSEVELIELKGYSRKDINLLLNAVDLLLFTSFSEGSPQLIKEAMACNCPIVSVDVGDIRNIVGDTEGCFITSYDPNEIASSIKKVFSRNKRTNGSKNIKPYDIDNIALKVLDVYKKALRI